MTNKPLLSRLTLVFALLISSHLSAQLMVSGAGASAANGIYNDVGTWNSHTLYKKDGADVYIYWACHRACEAYHIGGLTDNGGGDYTIVNEETYYYEETFMGASANPKDVTFWSVGDNSYIPVPSVRDAVTEITLSTTELVESEENDGSFSESIRVTHNDYLEQFTGTNGEDFLISGKASLTGIPAGLTATLIRLDSNNLELTFSGTADVHNVDANPELAFDPTALTDNDTSNTDGTTQTITLNFVNEMTVCGSGCDHTTIQAAIDAAGSFDKINIGVGTYTEALTSDGKSLSLIGEGAKNTIVQLAAAPETTEGTLLDFRNAEFVYITGLTFRNGYKTTGGIPPGVYIQGVDTTHIIECEILDHVNTGVGATYNCALTSGGYTVVDRCLISGNKVTSTSGQTANHALSVGKGIIRNTTITNNKAFGTGAAGSQGCVAFNGELFVNNTITGNTCENTSSTSHAGVVINGNTLYLNNIIYGNTDGTAAQANSREVNGVTFYNCIVGAMKNPYSNEVTKVDCPDQDPLLGTLGDHGGPTRSVDVQNGSPAMDGSRDTTFTPDVDQRGYNKLGKRDIGAFEFGGSDNSMPVITYQITPGTLCKGFETVQFGVDSLFEDAETTDENLVISTRCNCDDSLVVSLTGDTLTISSPGYVAVNDTLYIDAADEGGMIVTMEVIVNTLDVDTSVNYMNDDETLMANATGASFQWLDCDDSMSLVTDSTAASFTPGRVGNFAVEVTQSGCVDTSSCHYVRPCFMALNTQALMQVSCNGEADGVAEVTASNGYGSYNYLWNNGDTTSVADGLVAGSYTVTVTDSLGCQMLGIISITEPAPLAITMRLDSNVTCYGDTTGGATAIASGGTVPYDYQWNDVDSTADSTVAGVQAGEFIIIVTDTNDCQITDSITITQPTELLVTTMVDSIVTCSGLSNGGASVSAEGGVGPYSFEWSNDTTDAFITGVPGGNYMVTATDANGCETMDTVFIDEADPLQADIVVLNEISCYGANDGSIMVEVEGGVPPLSYEWENDSTTAQIDSLGPETYLVTVTDSLGCETITALAIDEPDQLVLSVEVEDSILCYGGVGSLRATVNGGTFPYTYAWSNQSTAASSGTIEAGEFTLEVTDTMGCVIALTDTLIQPDSLDIIGSIEATYFGGDGRIDIEVTGGTGEYSFDWDIDGLGDKDDNQNINTLAVGYYTVVVEDENGCSKTIEFYVPSQVSVSPVDVDRRLRISPNPTNGVLHFQYDQLTIQQVLVFDLTGKRVYTDPLFDNQMDISHLMETSYIVRVITDKGAYNKIIIKK